jgi:hypothetical protein
VRALPSYALSCSVCVCVCLPPQLSRVAVCHGMQSSAGKGVDSEDVDLDLELGTGKGACAAWSSSFGQPASIKHCLLLSRVCVSVLELLLCGMVGP